MAFHFIPGIDRIAPLGSIGVRLFFVLSGFLITRILLQARGVPIGEALRAFYIRRGLRIFPVFYLALAIAALIGIGPVRQTLGWHVTYLTNAYLFMRGDWHGSISHLWSLAVEEQFYLIWPWLVLLMPAPRLTTTIVAMIAFAPISRILVGGTMHSVLPTSCLDSLGAGALLALPAARPHIMRAGLLVGMPLVALTLLLRSGGAPAIIEVPLDFGVSLAGAWVVGRAITGFDGLPGWFLSRRPVIYIGTISYGLYLFHGFMPYVLGRYVDGFIEMPWPLRAMWLTAATTMVAALSWHIVERPILALKEQLAPALPARRPAIRMG